MARALGKILGTALVPSRLQFRTLHFRIGAITKECPPLAHCDHRRRNACAHASRGHEFPTATISEPVMSAALSEAG
jgi:hypothetical protein